MNKQLLIVSASKGAKSNSLLFKTFNNSDVNTVNLNIIENNTNSLASVYNKFINESFKDYIICFTHDDVCISDSLLVKKIKKAVAKYDIFGVAGGSGGLTIKSDQPALWHLISKDRVGFAGHYDENTNDDDVLSSCWVTNFGKSPQDATLLDGVFLGVNIEKVLEKNVRFDENCPSKFHFYDLLFSINAKKAGLRLGVVPISLFHKSHGLTNLSQEFINGDMYFKNYCAGLNA